MAAELARYVDPGRPQVVVEVGAGTGAVTRRLAAAAHPRSRLIAAEVDPDFAARLTRAVAHLGVDVVTADVADLDARLDRLGVGAVDVIVSGLPTPSLPAAAHAGLMAVVRGRGRAARFSQLSEFPWAVFRRFYAARFARVGYRRVAANLPPGGVYHCRRPLPAAGPLPLESDGVRQWRARWPGGGWW